MTAKRKGGGKLSRSEVVTVRLDPKLRFSAELAARKQRRTLSSFIEWAIAEAIKHVHVTNVDNEAGSVKDAVKIVWDVEEADRLVNLALNFPELLTFDEESLWKIINEHNDFWYDPQDYYGPDHVPDDLSTKDRINLHRLRENWETLQKIMDGEAKISDLTKDIPEPPKFE